MGLIKLTKETFKFVKSSKTKTKKDDNQIYNLIINDSIVNVNIRNIKTINAKFGSLAFKENLNHDIGFRFINAKGFNSIGFRQNVDLVFCDRRHQVVELFTSFKPNKMTEYIANSTVVYVLASNSIKYLNIKPKDIVKITK
ncbi:hypothetical protein [Spiroplasma culicicola]|uniref:Uncharacterized protein n=1 Tax=Spiroplasma culicicola AES-1 TaxID=1276246 RepID=W6AGE1_9MOLU|nr:hypothetical protein [Spiroplasma culicicola]AHI52734.1 hypothetical protein SCULI_v1c03930 [Spiroplasma culicicola AES-1]